MFFIQIILLCLPAFLFANISSRRAPLNSSISADPPDGTNITQVTNSGNGCPRNTLTITTNPDQTIVFSKLNAFETNLGPNISPAEKSKNCAFHVSITYPADWQFMLVQSTFFGWARVDQGIGGHFYTQYFVASNASYTFSSQTDITADLFLNGANYTLDQAGINPTDLWSACTQSDTATFNNRLALESSGTGDPNASGALTGNGADNQSLRILWRQC